MEEKITETTPIYDGKLVNLVRHTVELPDGSTSQREIVQHPGAAAIVAVDESGETLLVRQYRLAAGRVTLEIPAGTLEPDEDPRDCALRELQEETGYKADTLTEMGGLYTAPGYTSEYIHLYMATDLSPSRLAGDVDELIEVVRVPLADALTMIETGEIVDAKSITGLLRVARRRGV